MGRWGSSAARAPAAEESGVAFHSRSDDSLTVSVTELKQTIDTLGPEERVFVAAYLQHLARVEDPQHQAKLGERMRRMDAGRKITLDQAQRLHEALEAEGL